MRMPALLFTQNSPEYDFRKEILSSILDYLYTQITNFAEDYLYHLELRSQEEIEHDYFKYLTSHDFIHPKLLPIFLKHFALQAVDFPLNLRAGVFVDSTEAFGAMVKTIRQQFGNTIFIKPKLVKEQEHKLIRLTLKDLTDGGIFPLEPTEEAWLKGDVNMIATALDDRKRMKGDFYAEYASMFYQDLSDLMESLHNLLLEIYANKIVHNIDYTCFSLQDIRLIHLFLSDAKLKYSEHNTPTIELATIVGNLETLIIPNFQLLASRTHLDAHIKQNNLDLARKIVAVNARDLTHHEIFKPIIPNRQKSISIH